MEIFNLGGKMYIVLCYFYLRFRRWGQIQYGGKNFNNVVCFSLIACVYCYGNISASTYIRVSFLKMPILEKYLGRSDALEYSRILLTFILSSQKKRVHQRSKRVLPVCVYMIEKYILFLILSLLQHKAKSA